MLSKKQSFVYIAYDYYYNKDYDSISRFLFSFISARKEEEIFIKESSRKKKDDIREERIFWKGEKTENLKIYKTDSR